jgi:ribose transport system permease protein
VRRSIARIGPALMLVLVVALFALLTQAPGCCLSAFNLRIVLAQTVIVAVGAIGMTIVIVSGGIDLSVGATIALTGVVAALPIAAGWPAAVAAAVLAGGLVGLANGLLISGLRVVPFIATLGMLGVARGVANWLGARAGGERAAHLAERPAGDLPATRLDAPSGRRVDHARPGTPYRDAIAPHRVRAARIRARLE